MSFLARYTGECAACLGEIQPGQLITKKFNERTYTHVICPEPAPELKRPVCDKCFTEKSAAGTCNCD
jgi:hypothetical protein